MLPQLDTWTTALSIERKLTHQRAERWGSREGWEGLVLKPHLDPEGIAGEMERRRRVADALRAAELAIGSTHARTGGKRALDLQGRVTRLIGWLRRVPPVPTVPIDQAETQPSGPIATS